MSNLKDKMPPSNISAEEFFKYYCKDDNAIIVFEAYKDEIEDEKEDLQDRLHNNRELIADTIDLLEQSNCFETFKKEFKALLDYSKIDR